MNNLTFEIFENGIKFIQGDNLYKFSQDSIDLAKFCNVKNTDNVLELCAGCGAISFYLYGLKSFKKMYLNEINKDSCDIIKKNIYLNNLQDKAICLQGDLNNIGSNNFSKKLDVIICNPPYYNSSNKENKKTKFFIAKHESETNLENIITKSKQLLKDRGKLYIVMTATRTAELIALLDRYNFSAKRIKFLTSSKKVYSVLIEAVLNGGVGVKIEIC